LIVFAKEGEPMLRGGAMTLADVRGPTRSHLTF
jgi:hypothetical protein